MPELPEVEHTRKNLGRWMHGARIVAARALDRIVVPKKAAFDRLAGRRVDTIERRGKWLKLALDDGTLLFAHLGMTGDWQRHDTTPKALRFERARIDLAKGSSRWSVRYVDARRLGRILVTRDDTPTWRKLGPDPLGDGIDEIRLAARLARRKKRSIKEVLMDQTVLAGVGNIQAIEALWRAKIDPRSDATALDDAHIHTIARAIRWTIDRTLADLTRPDGGEDNPFMIYGRKGTPCPRCKTALHRIELGGRTTTFCPGCQVLLKKTRSKARRAPGVRVGGRRTPTSASRRGARRAGARRASHR
jgi:formamidopyrimidine-DNA glycosylase